MIKPIPRETVDYNEAYDYRTGDNFQYKTTVVIDGLNDDLVMMPYHMSEVAETSFCTCKGFQFNKKPCKHLISVLAYLKTLGINHRFEEPKPKEAKNELQTETNNSQ